jgi:hypothetical protein
MSIPLKNLKFKYLRNDQNVYVLTAPSLQPNPMTKSNPFNTKQTFGNTRFYTVPYQSSERGNQRFNVLFGYTRKHDGDLALISCVPREQSVELASMCVQDARQVATALCLPLLVWIGEEADEEGKATAYFHDPRQRNVKDGLFLDGDVGFDNDEV